jgi:hypothetical protein
MTAHTTIPPILSAMQALAGAPHYDITETATTRTGHAGTIRVNDAAELQAAMTHWRNRWMGYEPRIHADETDPCLASWSRWNTCE